MVAVDDTHVLMPLIHEKYKECTKKPFSFRKILLNLHNLKASKYFPDVQCKLCSLSAASS